MNKPIVFVLALIAAVSVFFFFRYYKVEGLGGVLFSSRDPQTDPNAPSNGNLPPVARTGDTIRIASFNIQVFGDTKSKKPHVMEFLAKIIRQFDVVAVQEVCSENQDVLPRFVDLINSGGRNYDYVIGPRVGPPGEKEQHAFLFDKASLVVDRRRLYPIEDPDDLLCREPLVAHFRVRGPPEKSAFTFMLVNVRLAADATEAAREVDSLDDVYYSVRDDGSNEDDVILLGDFNLKHEDFGQLRDVDRIAWVVKSGATDVVKKRQYDNIVYHEKATAEFTGRGGVFDFMREYGILQEDAMEVSDHLPVWAEFSIYEGGQPGRVAPAE